ncbi:hypothetical protein BGZ59_007840, partial [Podila verticillata]
MMGGAVEFDCEVSKTIANNALHQDINGGDHLEGEKNSSYPEELPVCPFTQDQLDAKYRDAMLPYLQKHFSPLEAISSILKTSCGPSFDGKVDNEIHKNTEKAKEKKTKDPTKEQTKDQLKDMAKLKVESEAKKNSTGKARGKATDRPGDRWLPEIDSSKVEKCGGDDSSNAAKVSAQEKTRDTPGKDDQRGAPHKQGPTIEASQKLVAQGIDKESLQDSTAQDQPNMLMTVPPAKDN